MRLNSNAKKSSKLARGCCVASAAIFFALSCYTAGVAAQSVEKPEEQPSTSSMLAKESVPARAAPSSAPPAPKTTFSNSQPIPTPVKALSAKLSATKSTTAPLIDESITVRASSEQDAINIASNVLGRNLNTRWSAKGDEQWIELVFKHPRQLDYVDLAFYKGGARRAYFDVKTSLDGESWSNQISDGLSSGKSAEVQRFSFPTTTARFVRYVGYGNNSIEANSRPWNSLTVFLAGSSKSDINDASSKNRNKVNLSRWKLTFPDASEVSPEWLVAGKSREGLFYYDDKGGLVFRTPNIASASPNYKYPRTELREMLMGAQAGDKTQGYTKNNWVLSVADQQFRDRVGGVDGSLEATLAVNKVSSSGSPEKIGRVIVGQVHASEDEPLKLFYRLLPGHDKGSVYINTETRPGKVRWYTLLGNKAWKKKIKEPKDGIALNEIWSYHIEIDGLNVSVAIEREGQETITKRFKMHGRYKNDWMYFKAGNYNQNNTGSEDDYSQVSFYRLLANHQ